jgi:excisionase family DNA binding protein
MPLEDPPEEKDPMLTMPMTPGESRFLPLADAEKGTLKIISGIAVDQPILEEGRVTFNFRLKTDETLKMLKPEQVCQMLQISKTFLVKLVKKKTLRSYKFGRLRRFLLADVIDYMTRSEDILGQGSKNNNETPGFRSSYNN